MSQLHCNALAVNRLKQVLPPGLYPRDPNVPRRPPLIPRKIIERKNTKKNPNTSALSAPPRKDTKKWVQAVKVVGKYILEHNEEYKDDALMQYRWYDSSLTEDEISDELYGIIEDTARAMIPTMYGKLTNNDAMKFHSASMEGLVAEVALNPMFDPLTQTSRAFGVRSFIESKMNTKRRTRIDRERRERRVVDSDGSGVPDPRTQMGSNSAIPATGIEINHGTGSAVNQAVHLNSANYGDKQPCVSSELATTSVPDLPGTAPMPTTPYIAPGTERFPTAPQDTSRALSKQLFKTTGDKSSNLSKIKPKDMSNRRTRRAPRSYSKGNSSHRPAVKPTLVHHDRSSRGDLDADDMTATKTGSTYAREAGQSLSSGFRSFTAPPSLPLIPEAQKPSQDPVLRRPQVPKKTASVCARGQRAITTSVGSVRHNPLVRKSQLSNDVHKEGKLCEKPRNVTPELDRYPGIAENAVRVNISPSTKCPVSRSEAMNSVSVTANDARKDDAPDSSDDSHDSEEEIQAQLLELKKKLLKKRKARKGNGVGSYKKSRN